MTVRTEGAEGVVRTFPLVQRGVQLRNTASTANPGYSLANLQREEYTAYASEWFNVIGETFPRPRLYNLSTPRRLA